MIVPSVIIEDGRRHKNTKRIVGPAGPVAEAFMNDGSFIRGIMGPIGSGKSTVCVLDILNRSKNMPVWKQKGRRCSRWAIVRNTMPELKSTTIKTWHDFVPKTAGRYSEAGPTVHHIQTNDFDMEVFFLGLDRPEDVKKLLSMELTGAWINEAREVPKEILDGLIGRVGRYPPRKSDDCIWSGIIMDTNPPPEDHWWYFLAEMNTLLKDPNFKDPKALELFDSIQRSEEICQSMGILSPGSKLYKFFRQPGAREAGAENLQNLDKGYYVKAMANTADWVRVHVDAQYGFIRSGSPVWPEYKDQLHCQAYQINKSRCSLYIGMDFGLTPAAIFILELGGRLFVDSELTFDNMGAKRFGRKVLEHIYNNYSECQIVNICGDPAGQQRAQTDEETVFEALRSVGLNAIPCHTNDFTIRREAVAQKFESLIDGNPAILINSSCKMLRAACAGQYFFKEHSSYSRVIKPLPEKNIYSHPADAFQYAVLATGAGYTVFQKPNSAKQKPTFATGHDYNPLDYDPADYENIPSNVSMGSDWSPFDP